MGWRIFVFIACVVGILITSFWAIESIKTVSDKFKISDTFIGSVFLSVGTSFPEFVNSIYSGIKDRGVSFPHNSLKSFYNITGANICQILFLSLVIAGFAIYAIAKRKSQKNLDSIVNIFWKDSFLSWKLAWGETLLLTFIFIFPGFFQYFVVGGFNFWTLFFLLVWIGYTIKTYKLNPSLEKKEPPKYFTSCGKIKLISITLSLWILFGIFSCVNFWISSSFEIDPSASFGVILSFITSSPEFFVLFFLFKQKEYKIAVSSFFGSSLFNLSLPFYSNVISANNIFGRNFPSEQNPQFHPTKITIWLILNVAIMVMFLITFNRHKKHQRAIMICNGSLILALYVVISVLLSSVNF